MSSFAARMIGASRFDVRVYEEVEADSGATDQALFVVLLSSLGAGLGWMGVGPGRLSAIALLTGVSVVGWVTWALMTYLIGTRWFGQRQTRANPGQLLRTLGFAQAPGVLRVFGLVPGVGSFVTAVVAVWTLATMVVAVRQALDYSSTVRALAVCLAGWGVALALFLVVGILYAPPVS